MSEEYIDHLGDKIVPINNAQKIIKYLYEKNEMIIVGDDLGTDILGGIENDIDTCWFNSKKINNDTKIKPKYEINDLIELKQLL